MRLLYKTGPMESLRKWFYKPKRDDRSLLAQFFFADDALNMIAAELDSFDGRKDPERCSTLVNQLRHAQDRVLNITSQIMDQLLGDERVARGFRVKFPEDVLQDNLAGQLWFGAECLAAGSSIMNREEESAAMRPLAKALTRSLETVRSLLREQCLRPRGLALSQHDDMLHESLRIFDRLFAEFELCYVSAMVNVKTPHEFEAQQLICVLFSESLRRALKQNLLTQEQVDSYDPALMFAVPRLAIVSGLLIYSSGPLSIDKPPEEMSDMFRPFRTLLHKIRSLLWTLDRRELMALERLLCTNEDVSSLKGLDLPGIDTSGDPSCYPDIGEFVSKFYADHAHCRDLYNQPSSHESVITESDYLPDNIEVMTPIIDGLRRLSELEEPDSEVESITKEETRHEQANDTFQTESRDVERTRKTSRGESSDLSSLRNLSTNGLMMFDPLVINAVSASTSGDPNRQIPDQDLVTSLNEQVTEIADRLSSIVTDTEILDHNSNHSFSTNDVPTLIATESSEPFGFSGPRNEQMSGMPSTSHGYLIPNAISQEPVILASLSHNNSVVFNQQEVEDGDIDESQVDVVVNLVPDNVGAVIVNSNLSLATVNLSSLLLTNDEFRHNFRHNMDERERREGTRQANTSSNREASANNNREEKTNNKGEVKGTNRETNMNSNKEGRITNNRETRASNNREAKENNNREVIESSNGDPWTPANTHHKTSNRDSNNRDLWADNNDSWAVNNNDSWAVSNTDSWATNNPSSWATNTRAPSTNSQDDRVKFMVGYESDQDSPTDSGVSTESTSLDRSPDTEEKDIKDNNYVQQNRVLQSPVRETNDDETNNLVRSFVAENTDNNNSEQDNRKNEASSSNLDRLSSDEEGLNEATERIEPRRIQPSDDQYMTVEELITKFQRARGSERKMQSLVSEYNRRRPRSLSANSHSERQRKSKKNNKKKSKMWSPGSVILDNRSTQSQNSPLRLDLDHFVDESGTPSGTSECADDEQIALALQAQELAARQQARGKFKSSEDLIHRLFVCIAGVADQLQTNFAADLRNILKSVFLMNQTPDEPEPPETPPQTEEKASTIEYEVTEDQVIQNGSSFDSVYSAEEVYADSASDSTSSEPNTHVTRRNTLTEQPPTSEARRKSLDNPTNLQASVSTGDLTFRTPELNSREENSSTPGVERAPEWVPDIAAPACMRCSASFTAFRRRHHCRNCGKVFCASCSSNSIPLPRFGQLKPVRVCEECYRSCEVVRSRVR